MNKEPSTELPNKSSTTASTPPLNEASGDSPADSPSEVTRLLVQLNAGDQNALDRLMPLMYEELRDLARGYMRREMRNHTLGATELLNEVYLKLVKQQRLEVSHRTQFIAVASQTMRNFLIDYARSRKRIKRGGGEKPLPLDEVEHFLSEREAEEVIALDDALDRLSAVNRRAGTVVQYRFYGGLTLQETADELGISVKSVQRAWIAGRAWLRKEVAQTMDW